MMKGDKRLDVGILLVTGIIGLICPISLSSQSDSAGMDSTFVASDSTQFSSPLEKTDSADTVWASSPPVIYDSSSFTPRQIPRADIESYLKEDAFDYARKTAPSESFLDRILDWLGGLTQSTLGTKTGWNIFQYGVFAAALILVIVLLARSELTGIFKRRIQKGGTIEFEEVEDDITRMDFNVLIADAIAAGNLRRAVRLHYQNLLKVMTERELIEWRREKTNSDYLYELRGDEYRPRFAELTRIFDYVWYGGFDVPHSLYTRWRSEFETFTQRVEKGR